MKTAMVSRDESSTTHVLFAFVGLDTPKMGVWILDGDVACSAPLLRFALKPESVEHAVVILVGSMTHPWSLLNTLKKWTTLIEEHLDRLRLDPTRRQEMRDRLQRDFQHYIEPTDASAAVKSTGRVPNSTSTLSLTTPVPDEQIVLPLPDGVLSKSLGIPVMVVITKVIGAQRIDVDHGSSLSFSVTPCRPWRKTTITKTNSSISCNTI
jgi:dynein light intermediate chain 1, cytosolic